MPHSLKDETIIAQQTSLTVGECFWNKNLPRERWTEECPDFLLGITGKNKGILSSEEADYHNLTWQESQELVANNRIDIFQRSPIELRRYLHFMYKLKQQYGSVLGFIQQERLHWDSITPSGKVPFTDASDYMILYNDWPYGIDRNITHLVVWTKFLLDDDPDTGFLTEEHHGLIETFVTKIFCTEQGIGRENLIWFKNWRSIKSVHALEHFHVMLYKAPESFLQAITNNDQPMSAVMGDL